MDAEIEPSEKRPADMRALKDSPVYKRQVRIHYYVRIGVSTFLSALFLVIGVPVFMESRVTGSLSYTALGVLLVAFGLLLALAVVVLLFKPPLYFISSLRRPK